jgi:hypothetical protein
MLAPAPAPAAPSIFGWKVLLTFGAEFLPLLAAWRAGRLRAGDPAGQVGLTWAFMNVCTVIQAVGFVTGHSAVTQWGLVLAGIALPLLLVPPLLTWIGPEAKRRQPAVLAAFALPLLGVLAAFGPGREFTLLSRTVAHAALAALILLMLATNYRRSANPQAADAERGWAWIAGGHLAYCHATLTGRARVEALIARGLTGAARQANAALFVIYAVSMVAIAWGILASARQIARPQAPPRASRTPALPTA